MHNYCACMQGYCYLCVGNQFKLDSAELSSRPNLTLGTSSSTRLLSASGQSISNKHESNHDSESTNDFSKNNIFLQFLPASRFVTLVLVCTVLYQCVELLRSGAVLYPVFTIIHCSSSSQPSTGGFLFGSDLESRVAENVRY